MNLQILYHGLQQLAGQFKLEVRNQRVLVDMVLGMLASSSCRIETLAHALQPRGAMEGQYRRIQRFLANEHVDVASMHTTWTRLVLHGMQATGVRLLVDETKLSEHLGVMVLGVWGKGGCVPLAWRCYDPQDYPSEGQVAMIAGLLARVMAVIPLGVAVSLLADRGIGTSPELVRQVELQGVDVLFRVQGTTRFRTSDGRERTLKSLGMRGMSLQSVGDVFKKAGWIRAHITVAWDERCDQPWCLVSSRQVSPAEYANRFDQEVSFRDLKSDGFNWHKSHVWIPSHAERLLLVLAIAYWLILSIGQRIPRPRTGRASRWSAFRRGMEALAAFFRPTIAPFLAAFLAPSPPALTCVVQ